MIKVFLPFNNSVELSVIFSTQKKRFSTINSADYFFKKNSRICPGLVLVAMITAMNRLRIKKYRLSKLKITSFALNQI